MVQNFHKKTQPPAIWNTAAGLLNTTKTVNIVFTLPEFYESKYLEVTPYVFTNQTRYDMIIGRDLLQQLGMVIDFNTNTIQWNEAIVPMKNPDAQKQEAYIQDSESIDDATRRIKDIIEAKYEPANLEEVVELSTNLNKEQRTELKYLLEKHKTLFDGSLGLWENESVDIQLKPGSLPYHAKPYPIPRIYEKTLKQDLDRLCSLGVLRKINRSEWAAPSMIIPKKDTTVRFVSDFRELNKRIKRQPYPIPKIQDLMLKLEGFMYGTSLDLNMGYYHIMLTPESQRLCTIVFPFGKYEYLRLPMGLCNSPDILQEKMSNLMTGLEFVRTYIDDILILSKNSWQEHLQNLDVVLTRLENAGLKVNAKKSYFGRVELEYLGYWVTRQGIQPIPKK